MEPTVTLMGRTEEKLAAAADHIRSEVPGATVLTFAGDVTTEPDVVAAVEFAAQGHGLDICVAAAGDGTVGPVAVMPIEEWNRVLGVSLTGVFLTVKAAAASMMRAGHGGSHRGDLVVGGKCHTQMDGPVLRGQGGRGHAGSCLCR
ncbi:MAG: SDR family NAD(P)-dependent oxidoreductase [Microthrixaceae bacterium]